MYLFWVIVFAVCGLDQAAKIFVKISIPEFFKVETTIPFLKITHIKNFGAALGILNSIRWILVAITIIFIAYFLYLVTIKKIKDRLFILSAAFIVGGGISNLTDRVLHGHVIDYLSVSFFLPVCNLADYFISAGVILLGIYILKTEKTNKKSFS
ncbi:MAG: signal peptidase II [Clostridia bacterium]|nr:signal peptidase II [Clostridia bacterium]